MLSPFISLVPINYSWHKPIIPVATTAFDSSWHRPFSICRHPMLFLCFCRWWMAALCTSFSWTRGAVAARRGLWDCPSPTAAANAARAVFTVPCRIWPSSSLGSRVFPSAEADAPTFSEWLSFPATQHCQGQWLYTEISLCDGTALLWHPPHCADSGISSQAAYEALWSPVGCGAVCKGTETCCNVWEEGEKNKPCSLSGQQHQFTAN